MKPIQDFSAGVIAAIVRAQPPSEARTRFAWQLAVGPALARVTRVELDNRTLTVRATDGRWIAEIQRARQVILARLERLLGGEVTAIRTD